MQNIVIDTNVLVAAFISPNGNSEKVLSRILSSKNVCIYYSDDIIKEYKRVLDLEVFRKYNFDENAKKRIIANIVKKGEKITPRVSMVRIPHEDDRIFYDTALASNAILLTNNRKHFPKKPKVIIMTPIEYISTRTKIRKKLL
jgi:putative PIN family toxin of toxin-antitoxin system